MKITDLKVYHAYTLNDIKEAFDNGAFQFGGGMIYTASNNTLVLTSKYTKDRMYQDEIRDGKIFYTGMGQVGDQILTFGNKRLVDAKRDNTEVHIFLVYKQNEYKYYGRVELRDPYYYDIEPDKAGNMRKVLKFPLTFLDAFAPMDEKQLVNTITGGNVPIVRVVGACISDGSKYLLSCRSEKQGYVGKWEFPGGKVEKDETDEEAIKREIREEIGIDIDVSNKLDSNVFYEKKKDRYIELNVYNATIKSGEIKSKEGQKLEWKEIDELENLDWMNADINIVQTLIDSAPRKIVGTLDLIYKEGRKRTPRPSDIKRECQDYEKSQKSKQKAGEEAELAVIAYEANRLKALGRIDFVNEIKQMSKDSPDYGYDVLSYDVVDGMIKEIHIEVKSASFVGNKIEFFISQAELRNCVEDPDYKIYALLRFGRNYKLHVVKKSEFISDSRYISPITFKVSIPVEEF